MAGQITVTPTNSLSAGMEGLIDLLAGSATFQAWVGVGSASAAKGFIYSVQPDASGAGYPEGVDPAVNIWPFCFIEWGAWTRTLAGEGGVYLPSMEFILLFEGRPNPLHGNKGSDPAIDMMNRIGGITEDLLAGASGAGSAVQVLEVKGDTPWRPPRSFTGLPGDYYAAVLRVQVGIR